MKRSNPRETVMNGRTIARIALAILLVAGAVTLGVTAYNAGVTTGLADSGRVVVGAGGAVVAPGYIGYGYGWGHGFGFFGFFGGLLFLLLLFGLIRAAFGPRRGFRDGPGWYPGGWRDEGGRTWDGGRTWEERAREAHDAWHRSHPEDRSGGDPTARSTDG
jgi:hypothetical protein